MFNLQIIPVSPFQQNCCVIWDEDKNAVIIDAGDEADKIIQFVESQDLKLQKLLITHAHLDHIMAVEKVRDHFGVEVYGSHIDDKPLFEQLPQMCQMFGMPPVKSFLPDHWLADGDVVQVGALTFNVRHLPGHAPGHVGFFDFDNKIIFSGDVLFKDSIGRTDLYMGNLAVLLASIRSKIFDLPDDFIIVAGHGSHTTVGREKMYNPFVK
ncbi:MBL fold metallo-hydrolase [[Haemophilus] ducreyi]|uniref:MBL fold metallo-hydrolase n=1 Tax=Haemophilus ducreyi TaxID=730 RepID=UPI0006564DA7|nr:MBL fold metallo-hydrolase [[Haemophilus] ducreyi]AKO45352.1 beta-lactamase [[Haemophilus] ducreyi]AKO46737.1 beta-lactamase [[Haemophilus] ducreyi]AKO48077.1 beta-lactamase [[Haemophilus] ducreyi]AKO49464.1 beta-lactamase [[Haemophilus] ducreyi]ANF61499.1 MBL fold metallo-hydrolase [[Haemophilus] ducreyi]